jgi:hypothetical protein
MLSFATPIIVLAAARPQESAMPKTYTVGHRPLIASVQAWLLNLLGRSQPQTWPPRRKIG